MTNHDALDRIERRATAAPYRDGIMELLVAAVLFGVALMWEARRGELLALLALPIVIGAGVALERAKRRITYPRIGYAESKKPTETSPWGGVAFIGAGIMLMIGAVVVSGDIGDTASWRRWAPFLAGFLNAAGFWYVGTVSGLWRYRIVAGISIALGITISLMADGATYRPVAGYFAVMGALLAVLGAATLVVFLIGHPKPGRTPSIDS